jgi:hypothetical protein
MVLDQLVLPEDLQKIHWMQRLGESQVDQEPAQQPASGYHGHIPA